jgi:DNA (cytosine-5)-methyltransferase 1
MSGKLNYLDLFAGAGGLSEGFIRARFDPIAHVEMDRAACYTLRTRMAYHWLRGNGNLEQYTNYLEGAISRTEFYDPVPDEVIGSVVNKEIGKNTLSDIFSQIDQRLGNRKLDLIVGGPPCQAYSLVGRSRSPSRMKGDKRNHLYLFYAEFLKRYKPTYFVFENVTGLLSAKDKDDNSYLGLMQHLFHKCSYETEVETLLASDFGVPQNRKRVILVGKKGKSTGFYPNPNKCESDVSVKKFFLDLPALAAGEGNIRSSEVNFHDESELYDAGIQNSYKLPVTFHQARPHTEQDLEIYRIAVGLWNEKKVRLNYNELPDQLKTHHHRNSFLDRFKVVDQDSPSHTVVAHIAKDGHYYIHPDIKQNRSITPREAARLQTFPDDYYFESSNEVPSRTPAFHQIGNAVPVLLAQKIAEKLKENW